MNTRNPIRSPGPAKSARAFSLITTLVLLFYVSVSAQVMTVPSDLYCWWTGDGTYTDGYGTNTAVPVNGAGFGEGLLGQAFEFHGAGDYLRFELVVTPEPMTVATWIYPTAVPDGEMLIAGGGAGSSLRRPYLLIATNAQNQLVLRGVVDSVSNNVTTTLTLESTRTIPLNRWTHVAMTLSPESGMKLYLDGQLESASGSGKYWSSWEWYPWIIGGDGNTGSFRGRIDEMKTFFGELSQGQIQQIYSQEEPGVPMLPVLLCGPDLFYSTSLGLGDSWHFEVRGVSPGGLPLSYQWFFNGAKLPGETQYAIQFTNIQAEQLGSYHAIISNEVGSVTSPPAVLEVTKEFPKIVSRPLDTNAVVGGSAFFSVGASSRSGSPLSYQWQSYATNLPGKTGQTLLLNNLTLEQFGPYTVSITNVFGAVTSPPAVLIRQGDFPYIVQDPTNTSSCAGGNATFSVGAASRFGSRLSYQWQFYSTNLPIQTNQSLVLANLSPDQFGPYKVVVSTPDASTNSGSANLLPAPPDPSGLMPVGTNSGVGSLAVPAGVVGVAAISAGPPSLALITNGTVVAWGSGSSSALQVPSSLQALAISSGNDRALAVRADGTLAAWGTWNWGEPPSGLRNVSRVSVGSGCGIALKTDRSVTYWPGYLGAAPADCTNIVAVAAGSQHWVALKADGTVLAWGNNSAGQLQVPANLVNVVAVSACSSSSFALKSDGTLVSWGSNASVPAGLTNVVALAAGDHIRLALTADGLVFQWGDAYSGLPATGWLNVSNAVAVSAGTLNGLVLLGDGTPRMTVTPWDRTVPAWSTATLAGKAVGLPPLSYQWFLKGTPLAGQTRDTFSVTNAELPNAGLYTLVVSNELGTISQDLNLSVQPPPEPRLIPQTMVLHGNGTFEFGISTVAGSRLEIQVSSNLVNWVTLTTLRSLSDTVYYTDASAITGPRFYRAHVVP